MSLKDWIQNTTNGFREDGIGAITESIYMLYHGSWRITGSRLPIGTNVFTRDWDVLVILDGCRIDVMREIEADYSFIPEVRTITSVGSTSREWLAKTFTPEYADEISKTGYVTANPYTDEILGMNSAAANKSPFNPENWGCLGYDSFSHVDEVWDDGWNKETGTVLPRTVTDRAIHAFRSRSLDRLIVHYMQPHQPFIREIHSEGETPGWIEDNSWQACRRGDVSKSEVWSGYKENLRIVLDELELLLQNIDAETVAISSDHGNAIGEWRIYGHPNGFLHPVVKKVPWIVTNAEDTGEYEPSVNTNSVNTSVSERLEKLGYL